MSKLNLTRPKIDYWLTVLNAYFIPTTKESLNIEMKYGDDLIEVNTIKKVGTTKNSTTTKIYASGMTFDTISTSNGAEIALDVIALPTELESTLLGNEKIKDAFIMENTSSDGIDFGFGYVVQKKSGAEIYRWHPRCKLLPSNDEASTKEENFNEPKVTYTITAMPTMSGLWRVTYDTSMVTEGSKALTVEEFFNLKIIDNDFELPVIPEGSDV